MCKTVARLRRAVRQFVPLVFASAGCAPLTGVPAQRNSQTQLFAVLSGRDTLSYDLVTRCNDRVIGDSRVLNPMAQVHYEMRFGLDQYPVDIRINIWNNNKRLASSPSQSAHYVTTTETASIEVSDSRRAEIQRTILPPMAFPFIPNYVGLFEQLVNYLELRGGGAIPVHYLGSENGVAEAEIKRRASGSLVLRIGESEYDVGWDAGRRLTGAHSTTSKTNIVRLRPGAGDAPDRRCLDGV